jgi:hypothetical protein
MNRFDNKWDGLTVYKLFKDSNGNWFPQGMPKWVGFNNGRLIGEFDSERHLNIAFFDGVLIHPEIHEKDYKGITRCMG